MKLPPAPGRWISCLLALLVAAGLARAHASHVSWGELDHNPEAGTWEMALRVVPEDLEKALSRAGRETVRLGRTPDLDERILTYLEKKLIARDSSGQPCSWRWVGKEHSWKEVWIYAELLCPDSLLGGEIENRIFLELDDEQVNTLVLRWRGHETTLTFHRVETRRAVAGRQAAAEKPPLEADQPKT